MLIDDFAPNPPFSLVRSRIVAADAETTMAAVLDANLLQAPAARALTWLRDAPNRVVARIRRQPRERTPPSITFGDITESDEWRVLGTTPGEEFVAGAIGRFWQRDYGWADFDAADFVGFDAPDHAKTVIGLRAEPHGPGRTLLTYENRTLTTDDAARRKFARYWFVLRPFVAVLMTSALRAIQREAEGAV